MKTAHDIVIACRELHILQTGDDHLPVKSCN